MIPLSRVVDKPNASESQPRAGSGKPGRKQTINILYPNSRVAFRIVPYELCAQGLSVLTSDS